MVKIGVTEREDAGLDFTWMRTYKDYDGIILITRHLSHRFLKWVIKEIKCKTTKFNIYY